MSLPLTPVLVVGDETNMRFSLKSIYLSPRNAALLAVVFVGIAFVVWLVRRQRRLIRADLQNRGLVPCKRRHRRRSSNEKRNPTLAEIGTGLPPVRETPPPGPTDGK